LVSECQAVAEEREFSFRLLKKSTLRNYNWIQIFNTFSMNGYPLQVNESLKFPLGILNKQLFYSKEELLTIMQNLQPELKSLAEDQTSKLQKLLSSTRILFTYTDEELKDEFKPHLNSLMSKNVLFTYLDLSGKTKMKKYLSEKFPSINLPCLIIDNKQILSVDKIAQIESHIDNDLILSTTDKKIDYLLGASKVVVFMKGNPEFPQCGFSRKIVEKLRSFNLQFGHFNIFTDEELRQRLKERFEWNTYPMVFLNKELVGGNEIIEELIENEEFEDMFCS
jgi:Grx4 family monothiol glutaredoxin